jgi:magnesium chelatase family protein
VVAVPSLREAAIWHGADLEPEPVEAITRSRSEPAVPAELDLADVIGNVDAVEALVVAAAGGHHLLMVGPPGAGKSMLAARLPGLLPDLDADSALEVASIRSLAGVAVTGDLDRRPPFEAPHHTCSAAALVGGGSGVIRPGAASRATRGVLFLDEAPEFQQTVLDCLRQPLESGETVVHRSRSVARFPARFQLVAAANPCPCGQYGSRDSDCSCSPHQRRRYLGKLSGPLVDRIDLQLRVSRISSSQFRASADVVPTATRQARDRVDRARDRAARRLDGTPWRLSGEVPGTWLRDPANRLAVADSQPVDRALETGALTMRGYDRVLRVAWTLADLDDEPAPVRRHVARALSMRQSL